MDTTPQKLADWLQDKTIYLWDSGDEQYYASPICEDIVPMLRQQQAEITKLKLEWQYMADLTEKLQDFAIWMTGCGYDFCQHEYFIKCKDELLKGVKNEQ